MFNFMCKSIVFRGSILSIEFYFKIWMGINIEVKLILNFDSKYLYDSFKFLIFKYKYNVNKVLELLLIYVQLFIVSPYILIVHKFIMASCLLGCLLSSLFNQHFGMGESFRL